MSVFYTVSCLECVQRFDAPACRLIRAPRKTLIDVGPEGVPRRPILFGPPEAPMIQADRTLGGIWRPVSGSICPKALYVLL